MDKLIKEIIYLWFEWIRNDGIARDSSYQMAIRRKSAERCERIVNKKYDLIKRIDRIINEYKRS